MNEFDLFGNDAGERGASAGDAFAAGESPPGAAGSDSPGDPHAPLAARMRPRTLAEFVGQRHILAPGRALRELIERDRLASLILWGPPGTGKTTLARVIAGRTRAAFAPFSAVSEGVPRIREIVREAETRLRALDRATVLFIDEIHRLNKGQQDALLPHVESGTVTLIGATTENPSFEVIGALLSRAPVFVLEPLSLEDLMVVVRRAVSDSERGLGERELRVDEDAMQRIAEWADGDARRALNALEVAATLADDGGVLNAEIVGEALQHRFARYDKSGEEHYNLISALHKAVRGSDPDAAMYWLSRMLEAGEDPLYLARRLVRMAIEDIGLADPRAITLAMSARDAYHFLGSPEGDLALGQAAVYLATAPKSNRLYAGMGEARRSARETPAAPVPLHVRNAPTDLMKDLGYGSGYRYAFESGDHYLPQVYMPEGMEDVRFYQPSEFGFEKRIAERLKWWKSRASPEDDASGKDEDQERDGHDDGSQRDAGESGTGPRSSGDDGEDR